MKIALQVGALLLLAPSLCAAQAATAPAQPPPGQAPPAGQAQQAPQAPVETAPAAPASPPAAAVEPNPGTADAGPQAPVTADPAAGTGATAAPPVLVIQPAPEPAGAPEPEPQSSSPDPTSAPPTASTPAAGSVASPLGATPPEAAPGTAPEPPSATPEGTEAAVAVATTDPQDGSLAEPEEEQPPWQLMHRRFSTHDGATGGLYLVDPGSGEVGALRLQLALDVAPADDFVETGNQTSRSDQTLSVSWTALSAFELYAAFGGRSTTFELPADDVLHASGAVIGMKLFRPFARTFHAGIGLRFALANEPGDQLPLLKASSIGIRAAGAFDLRELRDAIPLLARLNIDYLFDNTAKLIEDVEAARYAELVNPRPHRHEVRHLLSRIDRYALGINRVDRLTLGVGLETPVSIGSEATLHPLVEWRWAIPINRQNFDCAIIRDVDNPGAASSEDDSCLGVEGAGAWPMNLALGVRAVPPIRGVSLALSLDLGLSGGSPFVRELAPTAPFALMFTLGYDYDARPEAI